MQLFQEKQLRGEQCVRFNCQPRMNKLRSQTIDWGFPPQVSLNSDYMTNYQLRLRLVNPLFHKLRCLVILGPRLTLLLKPCTACQFATWQVSDSAPSAVAPFPRMLLPRSLSSLLRSHCPFLGNHQQGGHLEIPQSWAHHEYRRPKLYPDSVV
jgi:hypothetical protein